MNEALRYDDEKVRLDLVAPELEIAVGAVLTQAVASGKYPARNWELGMDWGRSVASLRRHLNKWQRGEKLDSESGLPHTWHMAANVMFLLTYEERNVGVDDRPPYFIGEAPNAQAQALWKGGTQSGRFASTVPNIEELPKAPSYGTSFVEERLTAADIVKSPEPAPLALPPPRVPYKPIIPPTAPGSVELPREDDAE